MAPPYLTWQSLMNRLNSFCAHVQFLSWADRTECNITFVRCLHTLLSLSHSEYSHGVCDQNVIPLFAGV